MSPKGVPSDSLTFLEVIKQKEPFPKGKSKEDLNMANTKGGSGKTHFSAPYKKVRVREVKVSDNVLTCIFTARKLVGAKGSLEVVADKHTATFTCETAEHARAVAAHIKHLHAREHRSGLIYSIRKLAEGYSNDQGKFSGEDVLKKAKKKAIYNKKVRDALKEEKAKQRRLEEDRRLRMERQQTVA